MGRTPRPVGRLEHIVDGFSRGSMGAMNAASSAAPIDLAALDRWPVSFPEPGTTLHAEWLQHVGDVPEPGRGGVPVPADAGPNGYLLLADKRRIPVDGALVLGRAPQSSAVPGVRVAAVVGLDDEDRVLSRSHVGIVDVGGAVEVIDLDSANGTFLVAPDGSGTRAEPGRRYRVEDGGRIVLAGAVPIMFRLRPSGG